MPYCVSALGRRSNSPKLLCNRHSSIHVGEVAMAWRIMCLMLLLVASFPSASIVQAQMNNPSQEKVQAPSPEEICAALANEAEKAEAVYRGISIEEVCAKKVQARDKAKRREAITLAVAAILPIVVIVIVFKVRRWIGAIISRGWRKRSKGFRAWAFGSFSWAMGTLLFVWLVEPYGSRMHDDEVWHVFNVMIVPPLFLGALWFGYKRFVDIEVSDIPPTDPRTGSED